jgi:hypothetical protein
MSMTVSRSFSPAAWAARAVRLGCVAALAWVLGAGSASAQVTGIQPESSSLHALLGKFYSVTFTPVNAYKGLPVNWSITPGCLAGTGLTFSPLSGVSNTAKIEGIPARVGDFHCVITAIDAGGYSFSKAYRLDVNRPCTRPRIISQPPAGALAGMPYSFTVAATGTPTLGFTALGLPDGLAIDPITGIIAGTTSASGGHRVTIIVTGCGRSALQDFELVVAPPAVALSLSSEPNPAFFGQAIAVVAEASGGATVSTGQVLLCVVAPGQYCAAPVGAPPPGTDPSLIPPLLAAPLDASGKAAFTLNGLSIQNYVLQGYYGGDAAHAPARAGPVDLFVIKGAMFPPKDLSIKAKGSATPIPTLSDTALALLALAIAGIVAAQPRRRARRG